jgi:hypothetical protein
MEVHHPGQVQVAHLQELGQEEVVAAQREDNYKLYSSRYYSN